MNDKRIIIGIGHKAGQGKDTAARHLQQLLGCSLVHFADALYDECRHAAILFKDDPPELYCKTYDEDFFCYADPENAIVEWIKAKGTPKTGLPNGARLYYSGMKEKDATLLQFWGTEFRRELFSWDYWVDKVRTEIEANPKEDLIIPDTRFENEAEMIKSVGGVVWKIDRTGFRATDRDPNHTSEIDLNEWEFDAVIRNDGTIPEFLEQIVKQFRKLKGFHDGKNSDKQG